MKYIYYKVCKYNNLTCETGEIISEGILRNYIEESIFLPNASNGWPQMYSIDNFSHPDYILKYWKVEITREYCEKQLKS